MTDVRGRRSLLRASAPSDICLLHAIPMTRDARRQKTPLLQAPAALPATGAISYLSSDI
jgi:hypothetical protein